MLKLAERLPFMGGAEPQNPFRTGTGLHLVFPARETTVRAALAKADIGFTELGLDVECRGVAELVLAEALNNVVEHAFADRGHGIIELSATRTGNVISVAILDDGVSLPDAVLPAKQNHDLTVDIADLPEGGFGWGIIHDLAHNIHYRRDGARNELRFDLHLTQLRNPL